MATAIFNHIAPKAASGVGIPQNPIAIQQPYAPNSVVPTPPAGQGGTIPKPITPQPQQTPAEIAKERLARLTPEQKAAFARFAASGAKPHPVGSAIPASGLSAAQLANYQNQTDTANLTYQQQLAQDEFLRSNENAQYGTTRGTTLDQYSKVRAQLPSQYEGRGLLNSGIYGQGLQDENTAKLNALQQILQAHQANQSGYDLTQTQQEQSRNATLAQIAAARAAAIQQLAASIAQPQ